MLFIYTLIVHLVHIGLHIVRPFSKSANTFLSRPPASLDRIADNRTKRIIIHCASLGEYYQCSAIAEKLHHLGYQIIISFFSPSGYEQKIKEPDPFVERYVYLPIDLPGKCNEFLKNLRPALMIFVKYEFWYNLISQLYKHDIPFIWISMNLSCKSTHLKWPVIKLFRSIKWSDHLFVQNDRTCELLQTHLAIPKDRITIAGDNRIETIIKAQNNIEILPKWQSASQRIFIYGSVYIDDIDMIQKVIQAFPDHIHLIVPHHVDEETIRKFQTIDESTSIFSKDIIQTKVVIVNRIGLLLGLYKYAELAYVGGGFQKGIHNCLEPLAQNIPCIVGPKTHGFQEIHDLADTEYIRIIEQPSQLVQAFSDHLQSDLQPVILREYFESNANNSSKIVDYVQNKLEVY